MEFLTFLLFSLKQLLFIFFAIVGIGFLIGIHEFGHFICCKLFNVRTPSFSIGFGPVIWKRKMWDTMFSISAIPLGGYVEIAGSEEVMQGEQKEAQRSDSQSLNQKTYLQKMIITFGGIFVNMIFAYLVLIALFSVGVEKHPMLMLIHPESGTTIVKGFRKEAPNFPAEKAGIMKGDKIIKINETVVENNIKKMMETLQSVSGQQISVTVERKGIKIRKSVTLLTEENGKKSRSVLGIELESRPIEPHSLGSAIKKGISAANKIVFSVLEIVKNLFVGKKVGEVGGPIMIISAMVTGAQQGIKIFLLLLAFISANLAALNLLPLPILDGGQALIHTIEVIIRRKLSQTALLYIQYASWISFLALFVYISIKDLFRLLGPLFGY